VPDAQSLIDRKRSAIRIRLAIERLSSVLWADAYGAPAEDCDVHNVKSRLCLAVGRADDMNRAKALASCLRLGHAYSECSDVMHGRIRAMHLHASRHAEWIADLERTIELVPGISSAAREEILSIANGDPSPASL